MYCNYSSDNAKKILGFNWPTAVIVVVSLFLNGELFWGNENVQCQQARVALRAFCTNHQFFRFSSYYTAVCSYNIVLRTVVSVHVAHTERKRTWRNNHCGHNYGECFEVERLEGEEAVSVFGLGLNYTLLLIMYVWYHTCVI